MVSFYDYCIDASEMKSMTKNVRYSEVPQRAVARRSIATIHPAITAHLYTSLVALEYVTQLFLSVNFYMWC